MGAIDVIKWLESPEGEAWSYEYHDTANLFGEIGTIVPCEMTSNAASTNAVVSELQGSAYAPV